LKSFFVTPRLTGIPSAPLPVSSALEDLSAQEFMSTKLVRKQHTKGTEKPHFTQITWVNDSYFLWNGFSTSAQVLGKWELRTRPTFDCCAGGWGDSSAQLDFMLQKLQRQPRGLGLID